MKNTFLTTSHSFILRIRKFSDKSIEKNSSQNMLNNVFGKSCRLRDNVEKFGRTGQATDDNMAHTNFMLDT